MKITAIGVNAAFSIGEYENSLTEKEACDLILEFSHSKKAKNLSKDAILARIRQLSQVRYQPRWHSNFLIEFDMPNKRDGQSPYRLLLDVGGDIRHALKGVRLSSRDIDGVYISLWKKNNG